MRVKQTLLLATLICLLFASGVAGQEQNNTGASSASGQPAAAGATALGTVNDQAGVGKYQLGPGDVIELRVYSEPTLTGKYTVNEEGNLRIPLVGQVYAKCRNDMEVEKEVVAALSKYIKQPHVTLTVVERQSRPMAIVYGAVRVPSRVQMNRRVRLVELLAVAGGTTEQAGGEVQVVHTEPVMCPQPEDLVEMAEKADKAQTQESESSDLIKLPFELYRLEDVAAGKKEANPYIRPGDIVVVQNASPIFITGAVAQPSNLYLRNGMTLFRALAQVGGPRKDAKTEKIYIYRQKKGQLEPEQIVVNFDDIRKQKAPDVELKPYDIIEVRDASKWTGKRLFGTLTEMISGTAQNVVSYGSVRIIN